MSPDYVYTKAPEWEIRTTPDRIEQFALPQGLCVELKWLDGDEFAHWTNPESFATSIRNRRKRREWLVWNALHDGQVPEGVVEIESPEGVHVVDHVTHTWLPRAPAAVRRRRPRPRQAAPARLSRSVRRAPGEGG